MMEYLIDYKAMATVRLKASSDEEALKMLAEATHDIYLNIPLYLAEGRSVELVNITNRDDDPLIVDAEEAET